MKLDLEGNIPPNFWRGLFVLVALCMGFQGGDLIGLV